ncbi:MAG: sulfotransferase, partial [Polymorphobacter sp.]
TKLRRLRGRLARARLPWSAPPQAHVFIITYGRTGSTLLQKLIGNLPGHYMAGENHDCLHGVFDAWRNAGVLKAKYGWGYEAADHPWHGADAADPDGYARAMVAAFIANILKPPRGSRVIGFKEIRYLTADLRDYLLFIDRFLAPAKFIINTRSVDAVAQSAWWKNVDKATLVADVARFEALTDALVAEFPDRFVKIDYARWTRDPEALRPVFALLGMPFDRAAIAATLDVRLEHMRK